MSVRVGINGFGRIGKSFLRAMLDQGADLEVVAVNDVTTPEVHAHLLSHDSILGNFAGEVLAEPDALVVNGHRITVFTKRAPTELPWGELGVDVVVVDNEAPMSLGEPGVDFLRAPLVGRNPLVHDPALLATALQLALAQSRVEAREAT